VVEIKGEIANGGDASAEFVVAAMKTAFEDEGAKGVVLLINSPGGSPVQAGIINDEIKRLKAKYKKPVYAVVEETCASAAYYIAAATDKIYVDKASIVGSIGVLMDGFGFTGVMEKVGVERRLLTAGENKGFLDPFSPMSDAQRAHAQTMLNQIHAQFINVVKTGRGDRLKLDTPGPVQRPVLERRASRRVRPGRPTGQRRLRGPRGHQGRRGDRLHAARQRGREAGQEVRRGDGRNHRAPDAHRAGPALIAWRRYLVSPLAV
jgi:signal peptide peptidase SppA